MKKLIILALFTFTTACSVQNNQILESESIESSISSINKNDITKSPMSLGLAKEIALLFDINKDGKVSANEFAVKVYISPDNKALNSESYQNWDYINKKELAPVTLDSIIKSLTYNDGTGFFSFSSSKIGKNISESEMDKFSNTFATSISNDSSAVKGKIPVGTTKYGMFDTKLVTEVISVNSLKKAIVKQLKNSFVELSLSNKLKNDGKEAVNFRLDGLENKYISLF
ncbi:MAG: hypothetical protein AABZ74_16355 [Cyanobacteriota bacterium]